MKFDTLLAISIFVISTYSFVDLYPKFVENIDRSSKIAELKIGTSEFSIINNGFCRGVAENEAVIGESDQPEIRSTAYLVAKVGEESTIVKVMGEQNFNGLGQFVVGVVKVLRQNTSALTFNPTEVMQIDIKGISPIEVAIKIPQELDTLATSQIPRNISLPGPLQVRKEEDTLVLRHQSFRKFSTEQSSLNLSKFGFQIIEQNSKNNVCPDFNTVKKMYLNPKLFSEKLIKPIGFLELFSVLKLNKSFE